MLDRMKNNTSCSLRAILIMLGFLMLLPITAYGKCEMYARLNAADSTLTLYYDENRQKGDYGVNSAGKYDSPDWNKVEGWAERRKIIKTVVFDPSFKDARPVSCIRWFYRFKNLEDIQGMENFNTSEVVSMEQMFMGCEKLTSIDLSHFDTGKVTDMYSMFSECESLKNLDLGSFNTHKVQIFDSMFAYCKALTSLNIASFNTESATKIGSMFYECKSLKNIDVSSFNTSNVTDMNYLFGGCESLESIDIGNFNVERVENMVCMFSRCRKLTSIDLSHFITSNLKYMWIMFSECSSLTNIDLSSFNTEKVEDMQSLFYGCTSLQGADLSNFNTANLKGTKYMFQNCTSLTSVDLSSFVTDSLRNMSQMFSGCDKLKTIYASSAFTTANLNEQYGDYEAFKGCVSLPNYDKSKTGKDMAHIGEGGYFTVASAWVGFDEGTGTLTFQCSSASGKADVSYDLNDGRTNPGWNSKADEIKKVVFASSFRDALPSTCSMWFYNCNNLSQIDGLENLNTFEAASMEAMFYGCKKLTSLDLSKFNTGNVTNMSKMFSGCTGFATLNLSGFNTQNVTDMQEMFMNCSQLTSLDLSSFKGCQVTTTESMFNGCTSLTSVNLAQFETSYKLKYLDKMFRFCSALTALDLSKFSLTGAAGNQMFDNCSSLQTIYVGEAFGLKEGNNMFNGCGQLRGAASFDDSKTGKEQANYISGYFKKKVGTNGDEIIGAIGNPLTIVDKLQLDDSKAFVLDETCLLFTAFYVRPINTEWATLCLPYAIDAASEGNNCLFYVLSALGENSVKLKRIENGLIAAGQPVIVGKKFDDQVDIRVNNASGSILITSALGETNGIRFVGTFESILAHGGSYILQSDGMFHRVADGNSTLRVGAYRAWLDLGNAGSVAKTINMVFDDSTTGIKDVNAVVDESIDAPMFDLMGRRIDKPVKGQIYIQGGKKKVAGM